MNTTTLADVRQLLAMSNSAMKLQLMMNAMLFIEPGTPEMDRLCEGMREVTSLPEFNTIKLIPSLDEDGFGYTHFDIVSHEYGYDSLDAMMVVGDGVAWLSSYSACYGETYARILLQFPRVRIQRFVFRYGELEDDQHSFITHLFLEMLQGDSFTQALDLDVWGGRTKEDNERLGNRYVNTNETGQELFRLLSLTTLKVLRLDFSSRDGAPIDLSPLFHESLRTNPLFQNMETFQCYYTRALHQYLLEEAEPLDVDLKFTINSDILWDMMDKAYLQELKESGKVRSLSFSEPYKL